ncbi:MAG TPA: hypothetical protein VN737_00865 [Bryobacteraceae bacterium]|nr:hypothetical protein [Bryobacteraceae bacterium]
MKAIAGIFVLSVALSAQTSSKGKQVVEKAVEALGGHNFLTMRNRVDTGRAYSFYRDRLSGLDIATVYTEYLDSKPPKNGVAVREREAYGKKQESSFLFLPDQGFQLTFRGARPVPDETWNRYLRSTLTNVFYLLRERWNDPRMFYDFVREDVLISTHVNIVDITDPEQRTVRVYFDYNTNLPIRQEYSEWDPVGQQRSTERTEYSKYRDAGGVQLPFVTERFRNEEKIFQLFSDNVQVNQTIPPGTFKLPPGVKMLKKVD